MNAIGHDANGNFALNGKCPHASCRRDSVFTRIQSCMSGQAAKQHSPGQSFVRWVGNLQCQGCKQYILGIVDQQQGTLSYFYIEHYPMGSPDETVADEIPDHIKADFKEALRCIWVKAYNATAEMCRRALEASCLDLGAPKYKKLEKMIDWLADNRRITPYLQDAAHKIRLGGNRGAHPLEDGPPPQTTADDDPANDGPVFVIGKEHAEAIIEFTREFFHHVYVGPKLLGKYDFSKPTTLTPPTP